MRAHLLALLARDGPWALFTAQAVGVFGLPIPDELLLMAAGALVRRGDLGAPPTIVAAIAGAAVGVTVSYVLGRAGGRILGHVPRSGELMDRAQSLLSRWGPWLFVFGYFVPGVRHAIAIAAGSARVDARRFCPYAYLGVAIWSLTFLLIGYLA
jgi:membrane protein DedA with SNARE-associated domain